MHPRPRTKCPCNETNMPWYTSTRLTAVHAHGWYICERARCTTQPHVFRFGNGTNESPRLVVVIRGKRARQSMMAVLPTPLQYMNTSNRPHEARSKQASPAQRYDCGWLESADDVRYGKCRFCAGLILKNIYIYIYIIPPSTKKNTRMYTLCVCSPHQTVLSTRRHRALTSRVSVLLLHWREIQALWSQATRRRQYIANKCRKETKTFQSPC